jgi:hypothetical protein
MGNICDTVGHPDMSADERRLKIITNIVNMDKNIPFCGRHLDYGTCGFRTLGTDLTKACFRVGILVGLRAKVTNLAGVMITASHNLCHDNGVKIIEGDGSMLN